MLRRRGRGVVTLVLGALVAMSILAGHGDAAVPVPPLDLDALPGHGAIAAQFFDDAAQPVPITAAAGPSMQSKYRPFVPGRVGTGRVAGWFRFAVRSSRKDPRYVLSLGPLATEADLYTPRGTGFALARFGMNVPFRDRPYTRLEDPAVLLTADQLDGKPLYLHVAFATDPSLPVVEDETHAFESVVSSRSQYVLFVGILAGLGLVNALLFVLLRESSFAWYSLVSLAFALQIIIASRAAWRVVWPAASVPYLTAAVATLSLAATLSTLFSRAFLGTRRNLPAVDALILASMFWQVGGLLLLAFGVLRIEPSAIALFSAPTAFLILAAGGILLFRGVSSARFFVVGALGPWLAGFFVIGAQPEQSPLPVPLDLRVLVGLAWQSVFLTAAVADRVRLANQQSTAAIFERERALEQLSTAQAEMIAELGAQNEAMERFVPRPFLQMLQKDSVRDIGLGDHTVGEMTLLFSDIRSFTTLAETMTPEETFAFINSYLAHTGPVIREHGGFIDKYIGDAIFALFPSGASGALDAAIGLQTGVARYNQSRARAGYVPIAIGVGLHRGHLALGAVGERERIDTTVIADAVNVASRMEGLTKRFGAGIVVSEAVVEALDDAAGYRLRSLGRIQVKGTQRGLEIFEVFDADPAPLIVAKLRTQDRFAAAVADFTAGRFEQSEAAFTDIATEAPADLPARHFAERSRLLATLPPGTGWDGIERLESK